MHVVSSHSFPVRFMRIKYWFSNFRPDNRTSSSLRSKNRCPSQGWNVTYSLVLPAGISDGSRLRTSGNGEAGIRGGPAGDLYVVIHVKEHAIFQREEDLFEVGLRKPGPFGDVAHRRRTVRCVERKRQQRSAGVVASCGHLHSNIVGRPGVTARGGGRDTLMP